MSCWLLDTPVIVIRSACLHNSAYLDSSKFEEIYRIFKIDPLAKQDAIEAGTDDVVAVNRNMTELLTVSVKMMYAIFFH